MVKHILIYQFTFLVTGTTKSNLREDGFGSQSKGMYTVLGVDGCTNQEAEKGEDFLLLPLLLSLGAQPMDGASHNRGESLLVS